MHDYISIRGVTKRFGGVTALADVSLDIRRGELHAVCGENGAGKSTLMNILSGVLTDYEGQITLDGRPVRFRSTRDAEAAGMSIIHQELNLVEQLSVAASIFLGREARTRFGLLDQAAMDRAATKLLTELGWQVDPTTRIGNLRVGDQQLVEIAKALSIRADVLIMDEPTSALTESEAERLFRVVDRLRGRGVTILYISHKMDEVFRLADRITVLRDGRLAGTFDRRQTDAREVTHQMVGREIEAVTFDDARVVGEEILRVENLSLPWPGHARRWRLENISFALRRGEILGIAGLMGAGRTELLESLFGASDQTPTGRILLDGCPVRFTHPADALAAGVALVTEDRKRLGLFDRMTVGENITLCSLPRASTAGLLSRRREHALVAGMIGRLDIKTRDAADPVTSLSGGNQQKTILGRWMLTRPRVLLLDDPTRGVDVGAKAELYQRMDQLCRDGVAILLTSSELPELITLCDRILVLAEGRLTGQFSRSQASEQRIMEAATQTV